MENEILELISTDLRGKSLENLSPDEIPSNTKELFLSNNKLSKLPDDLFFKKPHIWNLYLDYNNLIDLKFITCFGYLGTLDLRNNKLEIDELLEIRKIVIIHLYLQGNEFEKFTKSYPLTLPALLKKTFTINGQFITDNIRNQAKEFKKSIQFGETVLKARRKKVSAHQTESVSNISKSFIEGDQIRFESQARFFNIEGEVIQKVIKKTQIERILYLSTYFTIQIPDGNFFDYLGIILGILSFHWMNFPISVVPRALCRPYWSLIANDINKLDHWEQLVLLYKIHPKVKPETEKETEIWKRINLQKYIEFGVAPTLGSFPRMFISAFAYRSDYDETVMKSNDMKIYQKFRSSYDFGPADCEFESVYNELYSTLSNSSINIPKKNDVINIKHPLKNTWTKTQVVQCMNGRVILKVDDSFYQQMSLFSLFWDGRGMWRELTKLNDKKPTSLSELQHPIRPSTTMKKRTFLTVCDTMGDSESTKLDPEKFSIPLPPCMYKKKSIMPKDDPSYFLRSSQSITTGHSMSINEIDTVQKTPRKKKSASVISSYNDKKSMNTSFRGIVDPIPKPVKKPMRTSVSKGTNLVIETVINVTLGHEVGFGGRIRKFHVRVLNTQTNKRTYVWLKEDEIPEEDTRILIDLYKKQIQSKMIIIPNV